MRFYGVVKAHYVHRPPAGAMKQVGRRVGPYLVWTHVDFMGRATSTLWIKESF